MFRDKFKLDYDDEYDVLFIYSTTRRAAAGIEYGSIDLSFDHKGELVNMGINNASEFLSTLTKRKISKKGLSQIKDCKINVSKKAGLLYINFALFFEEKEKEPIKDTLTVKALDFNSPVSACS